MILKGSNHAMNNNFVRRFCHKVDFTLLCAPFHSFNTKSVPNYSGFCNKAVPFCPKAVLSRDRGPPVLTSMILSVKQWNFEFGDLKSRLNHDFKQTQLHRVIQFQERLDPYYYLYYHYVC